MQADGGQSGAGGVGIIDCSELEEVSGRDHKSVDPGCWLRSPRGEVWLGPRDWIMGPIGGWCDLGLWPR